MAAIRKGEVFAIAVTHSAQYLKEGQKKYTLWHLAICERSTRSGDVVAFRFAGQNHAVQIAYVTAAAVHSIIDPVRQTLARCLAEKLPPDHSFEDAASLKAAILSA